jgi:hypothetical protein
MILSTLHILKSIEKINFMQRPLRVDKKSQRKNAIIPFFARLAFTLRPLHEPLCLTIFD